MTINIPPVNIMEFLQANVIQVIFAVIISVIIGFSQKVWLARFMYFCIALFPAYYLAGIGIELVLSQNWRYIIGAGIVMLGTWVWNKK